MGLHIRGAAIGSQGMKVIIPDDGAVFLLGDAMEVRPSRVGKQWHFADKFSSCLEACLAASTTMELTNSLNSMAAVVHPVNSVHHSCLVLAVHQLASKIQLSSALLR